jgi:GNAT superfamily N-acetyltransferase
LVKIGCMSRVTIDTAGSADLAIVREMLQEYAAWLAIDLSFQDFTSELRDLPGAYAPPGGDLFMARLDGQPAGMAAFRAWPALSERKRVEGSGGGAEMKRLFVRPSARGAGVGRALVDHVIDRARAAGYRRIVLDTLPIMRDAQRLYEQVGFRDVSPYYDSPIPGTRFMARPL